MKSMLRPIYALAIIASMIACGKAPEPLVYSPPGEWSKPDEKQISEDVLREASYRYAGSFDADTSPAPSEDSETAAAFPSSSSASTAKSAVIEQPPAKKEARQASFPAQIQTPAAFVKPTGNGIVLGPIVLEESSAKDKEKDAGLKVREIIAQGIANAKGVDLQDAPEERHIDDSPRPDLARKGIRFVVKGTVGGDQSNSTVFLRVVDTGTGNVAIFVSGKGETLDNAAQDATTRLIQKLKGALS